MAQHGATGQQPAATAPPADLLAGELPLSAERRARLEPKLRALLQDFAKLEVLAGPVVEPWFDPAQRQEDDDAR